MTNSLGKTTETLVAEWPEVFGNVEISAIPVMYLDTVIITFITGMVWKIDVKNYLETLEVETIHALLQELIVEYHDEIDDIEYTFDVEELKKDVNTFAQSML